ncbi:transcriptional regulator domain protein [Brucella pseudogrignonensis]|uniref:Transcriptional regulator domain protein n=1 Tax=Brucella pseudogrignonensis TaxID=419475 RepID=A0A256G471_9HYPH|nr:transcriptional regulator domain protein [Brucella pseudogrignonensis]
MTRGGILEAMDQIVQPGILTETLRKDSMGRGTATQFEFARNVFEQIRM